MTIPKRLQKSIDSFAANLHGMFTFACQLSPFRVTYPRKLDDLSTTAEGVVTTGQVSDSAVSVKVAAEGSTGHSFGTADHYP